MTPSKDSFKTTGVVLGLVVVSVFLCILYWGFQYAGDAMSMDPAVNRQKRIEKKIDEMDIKFDQLIDLAKRWE